MDPLFTVMFGFAKGESREFSVRAPHAVAAVAAIAEDVGKNHESVTHILVRPNSYTT